MVVKPSLNCRDARSVSTQPAGIGSPVTWCTAKCLRISGSHAHISLTWDGNSTTSRGTSVPDCDGSRTSDSRPCSA